ncbi:MAG: glycosyl hydrolase, partial [Caldilinea sp.]
MIRAGWIGFWTVLVMGSAMTAYALPGYGKGALGATFFATQDAPTIDGEPDSLWAQARAQSVGRTVLGSVPAESNLSAYFKALYDTRALYLFVDITDDRLVQDSSEDWWEDDAVELYLDGDASLLQEYDRIDDYQLVLRWDDDAVYVGSNSVQAPAELRWAHRQTDKGWAVEIAFPWSALGIIAQSGVHFGFDLHISDDDDDGAREHKLAWHADRDDAWYLPSLFGLVGLGDDLFTVALPLALAQTAPTAPPTVSPIPSPPPGDPPANPNASPATRQLLAYLQAQSDTCAVISGQNIGSGWLLYDHYDQLVDGLQRATGRWPALVGMDYYDYDDDHTDYAESHPPLIEHWNAGGLVTLSWSSPNPWTGGDAWDTRSADLTELLDPSTTAYQAWRTQLDAIADALADLRDAGVVVLWRPLHEMSGDWFWWGTSAHPGNPAPYQALWRQMFDYFTDTRGLDNLLWVYSATGDEPGGTIPAADFYYPGNAYVDVVGQSVYSGSLDQFHIYSYDRLLTLGKPVALAEFGPGLTWMEPQDGDYDYLILLDRLRNRYPQTVYWLSWNDWVEDSVPVYISIVKNLNAAALMNDPCVTSRDEVDWRAPSAPTATPEASQGFYEYRANAPSFGSE